MKIKLRIFWKCIQHKNWKGAWFIAKTVAKAIAWPYCRRCKCFGWYGGSTYCWECQQRNLIKAFAVAEEEMVGYEQ